jgi:hypothetical protein
VKDPPYASLAVRVTVLGPIFAHVKCDGDTENESWPHGLELLTRISDGVMFATPFCRFTLMFWHVTDGAVVVKVTVTPSVAV